MTYQNDKLQIALNYDTYGRKVLGLGERCKIHQAISYKLNWSHSLELETKLGVKVKNILEEIRSTNYQIVDAVYYEASKGDIRLKII